MDKPNPYESPVSDSDGITPKYDSHDELVVLSTFSSTVDAQMLIVHLSQHGIDSRMGNELSGSSLFGATLGGPSSAFWVEVLIRKADAERALELKKTFAIPQEASVPEWTCGCGEQVDEGFEVCWNCSAEYGS